MSRRQRKTTDKLEELKKENLRLGEKGSVKGWSDKKLQRKEDKNLKRQRRVEEKLYKQKKKDDMTPEERIAAKQEKRDAFKDEMKVLEAYGQSRTFQGEGAGSYLDYGLQQERVDLANRRADSQELKKDKTFADPYDVTGMTDREIYDKEMESESMSGDDARFEDWKERRKEGEV